MINLKHLESFAPTFHVTPPQLAKHCGTFPLPPYVRPRRKTAVLVQTGALCDPSSSNPGTHGARWGGGGGDRVLWRERTDALKSRVRRKKNKRLLKRLKLSNRTEQEGNNDGGCEQMKDTDRSQAVISQ